MLGNALLQARQQGLCSFVRHHCSGTIGCPSTGTAGVVCPTKGSNCKTFGSSSPVRLPSRHLQGPAAVDVMVAPSATAVLVKVTLNHHVNIGEVIKVVGTSPEFGMWDTQKALQLTWTEGDNWVGELPLEPGMYEFKFVVENVEAAGRLPAIWEDGPNRSLTIPDTAITVDVAGTWGRTAEMETKVLDATDFANDPIWQESDSEELLQDWQQYSSSSTAAGTSLPDNYGPWQVNAYEAWKQNGIDVFQQDPWSQTTSDMLGGATSAGTSSVDVAASKASAASGDATASSTATAKPTKKLSVREKLAMLEAAASEPSGFATASGFAPSKADATRFTPPSSFAPSGAPTQATAASSSPMFGRVVESGKASQPPSASPTSSANGQPGSPTGGSQASQPEGMETLVLVGGAAGLAVAVGWAPLQQYLAARQDPMVAEKPAGVSLSGKTADAPAVKAASGDIVARTSAASKTAASPVPIPSPSAVPEKPAASTAAAPAKTEATSSKATETAPAKAVASSDSTKASSTPMVSATEATADTTSSQVKNAVTAEASAKPSASDAELKSEVTLSKTAAKSEADSAQKGAVDSSKDTVAAAKLFDKSSTYPEALPSVAGNAVAAAAAVSGAAAADSAFADATADVLRVDPLCVLPEQPTATTIISGQSQSLEAEQQQRLMPLGAHSVLMLSGGFITGFVGGWFLLQQFMGGPSVPMQ